MPDSVSLGHNRDGYATLTGNAGASPAKKEYNRDGYATLTQTPEISVSHQSINSINQ